MLWLYVIDLHFLQELSHFNGKAKSSYDPSDGRRGCCPRVCLFNDMKLCLKLCYPKKQLSVGKWLVLFKCQLHFKQYIKTKQICFGIKFYKLTSFKRLNINFFSSMWCSIMGVRKLMCQHQKEPLFTKYFFFLLVTPDKPLVSGNNDTIKRLSSVRYFS